MKRANFATMMKIKALETRIWRIERPSFPSSVNDFMNLRMWITLHYTNVHMCGYVYIHIMCRTEGKQKKSEGVHGGNSFG